MGRSPPAFFPNWTHTVAKMIEARGEKPETWIVRVGCDTCKKWRAVDLDALLADRGGNFSLVNRRYRCRLKPDCSGWNQFYYYSGVMRPLWDDATTDRWMKHDSQVRTT
ncbi:hypothetical protein, partial [Sphingomonas montanisoli]